MIVMFISSSEPHELELLQQESRSNLTELLDNFFFGRKGLQTTFEIRTQNILILD